MSRLRILYVGLILALAAALALAKVHAGDPNGDVHGIISPLLGM